MDVVYQLSNHTQVITAIITLVTLRSILFAVQDRGNWKPGENECFWKKTLLTPLDYLQIIKLTLTFRRALPGNILQKLDKNIIQRHAYCISGPHYPFPSLYSFN